MRKLFAILAITALLTPIASAEPIRHKKAKAFAVILITAAITTLQDRTVDNCRLRAGIEHCFGAYGSRKAMRGLVIAGQVIGAFSSVMAIHNDNPDWWVPASTSNSIFGVSGILQTQRKCGHATVAGQCVDISEAAHLSATKYRLQ